MTPTKRVNRARRTRQKVTYSLPEAIVTRLDERAAGAGQAKSAMVSEALAFYFAEQDRKALEAVYAEAATDPLFAADNAQVLRDFAALDRDAEDGGR
jgi:predicted transcriptional regulator